MLDLTPVDGSGLTGTLTAKTLEVAATEEEAKSRGYTAGRNGRWNRGWHSWKKQQIMQKAVRITENQDTDRTEDVQQNAGNEQEDGSSEHRRSAGGNNRRY